MKITADQRQAWRENTDRCDFNTWLDSQVKDTNGRFDLDKLYALARQYGVTNRYDHLNPGQQRMNIGNILRPKVNLNPPSCAQAIGDNLKLGGSNEEEIHFLLSQVKGLAIRYYKLTGKPLGVTGEVAEFEAAQKLGLELAVARTADYDAVKRHSDFIERIQIKGRAVHPDDRYRGRVPSIRHDCEYETVLLVLLDKNSLDVLEIWSAKRELVAARLSVPGSKSRNERNSMGISQFKSIASRVWPQVNTDSATKEIKRETLREIPYRSVSSGKIGELVSNLLMDASLDYAQIVYRVRLQFPTAQTSTKSVASTARDLRKAGVNVPFRNN